jgi:hypothetical protein
MHCGADFDGVYYLGMVDIGNIQYLDISFNKL